MIDPRYPNVPPETAKAMLEVLSRIGMREDPNMPSHDVQRKALGILDQPPQERGVTHCVARAEVYTVQGTEPDPYHVELFVQENRHYVNGEAIIDAWCSCPATTTCSHMLVALTSAERDGLHLAV